MGLAGRRYRWIVVVVDLEKAFDRVPREVISWAMRKLGVEEWLVSAVMSMYTGAKQSSEQSMVIAKVLR